jgi:hypothetical protein
MSRLPQTGADLAARLRDLERRLAELEARPQHGVIARQAPLTTSSATWTASATTDHAIPDVAVDAALRYVVRHHTSWTVVGNVRWIVNFHVDGALTDRIDDLDCFGSGTRIGEINAALEWLPPVSGIFDVDLRVVEVIDGGSLLFTGEPTATRQFWIEAAGPR